MGGPAQALPVVVIGGGLAGTAAAVVLAERGIPVRLLERQPYLGGRVGGWPDRLNTGEAFQMSRGFHAFFRQYRNVRALLGRIDPLLRTLEPLDDYVVLGPKGARESFARLPSRPPFNALALMWRSPTVRFRSLRDMDGAAAREMLRFDPEETFARLDRTSTTEYLDRLGMPVDARRMLFEIPARSFFNSEERLSAAEFVMMMHFYFLGSSDGLAFDVAREPFSDSIWLPLRRYLERKGASVETGTEAVSVRATTRGETWEVRTAGAQPIAASGVVVATEAAGARRLVARSPGVGGARWRESIASLENAPPFAVWRLWLDRPTRHDRPAFAATAGLRPLDNVSLLHHFEGESRRWAMRTGGAVVELHAYALPTRWVAEDLKSQLLDRLHALYPETALARAIDERWLVFADCPAFAPGSYHGRPAVAGPVPGLALAGDYVRLPFPTALMERAVASGMMAANHLLAGRGLPPEPILTVHRRGIMAALPRGRRGRA